MSIAAILNVCFCWVVENLRRLIVIMGVSGCGKSTIGRAVADRLQWPFVEGDDFHPAQNIQKMASGRPLTDQDRVAWLDAIAREIESRQEAAVILACSALTPFVQETLSTKMGRDVTYCWLKVSRKTLEHRVGSRKHFMPASLLDSQFEALSPPAAAKIFLADAPVPDVIAEIEDCLKKLP